MVFETLAALNLRFLRLFLQIYRKIAYRNPKIFDVYGRKIFVIPGLIPPGNFSYGKFFLKSMKITQNSKVLDMGCGTGVLSVFLSDITDNITCADIDPKAVLCSEINFKINGLRLKTVNSDLFDSIDGKFDFIIFNTPFVLTNGNSSSNSFIMKDLKRFSSQAGNYLFERGVLYLLIPSIYENLWIDSLQGFASEVVARKRLFTVQASVIKAVKT